jgi:hypothetical protein
MSLRKRARSLRRADSASELPLLREAMAAPDGASKSAEGDDDEGEHADLHWCNGAYFAQYPPLC